MLTIQKYESPFGLLTLASEDDKLVRVGFGEKREEHFLRDKETKEGDSEVLQQTRKWLDLYFQGRNPDLTIPLYFEGSQFQKSVWKILMEIPYGELTTYKEIAETIAKERGIQTMSAQAVGGAVGRNPLAIVIPCHRVVGTNKKLTGFAGGLEMKEKLLTLEGIQVQKDGSILI